MTSFLRAPWCAMLVFKQRHGAVLGFIIIVSLGFAAATAALHPKDFGILVDNNQDTISFLRSAYQAERQIIAGDYFPRVSSYDFSGYGYPLFQFYPPFSFLIVGYISAWLTHNVVIALALAVVIGSIAAGWLVFGLCRLIGLRPIAATIAAFTFISYPYFVFAGYRATPTFFAICFNTAIIFFAALYLRRPTVARALAVTLAVFGIFITHVITSLLTAVVAPVLILLMIPVIVLETDWRGVITRVTTLGIAAVLGFGLAAFEIVPILLYAHQGVLRISALLSTYSLLMQSAQEFTTIPAILSPRLTDAAHIWPPSIGEFGFQLGLPYVVGFVLFVSSVPVTRLADRTFWGVAGLFVALVLSTTPQVVPFLASLLGAIQFPFRLLSVAALPGALLVGRATDAIWPRDVDHVTPAASEFSSLHARAAVVVTVGTIVGWSALASQLEMHVDTGTGFAWPVRLGEILKNPSSTYSGDYLVNAYRFSSLFGSEPLLGRAQYFLYWHNFLAEDGGSYDIPAFRPNGNERLRIAGELLDGVSPPAHVRIAVGPDIVFDGTIAERKFSLDLPIKTSAEPIRAVTYASDKSVEKDGKRFFARLELGHLRRVAGGRNGALLGPVSLQGERPAGPKNLYGRQPRRVGERLRPAGLRLPDAAGGQDQRARRGLPPGRAQRSRFLRRQSASRGQHGLDPVHRHENRKLDFAGLASAANPRRRAFFLAKPAGAKRAQGSIRRRGGLRTGVMIESQRPGGCFISVVVPVYKEEASIPAFLRRAVPVPERLGAYEIIFALDPSPDRSEDAIAKAAASNPSIKGLVFSRRFGQPAATLGGILNANGQWVVVIDVDLQDPPELIADMLEKAVREGFDVVTARRRNSGGRDGGQETRGLGRLRRHQQNLRRPDSGQYRRFPDHEPAGGRGTPRPEGKPRLSARPRLLRRISAGRTRIRP